MKLILVIAFFIIPLLSFAESIESTFEQKFYPLRNSFTSTNQFHELLELQKWVDDNNFDLLPYGMGQKAPTVMAKASLKHHFSRTKLNCAAKEKIHEKPPLAPLPAFSDYVLKKVYPQTVAHNPVASIVSPLEAQAIFDLLKHLGDIHTNTAQMVVMHEP